MEQFQTNIISENLIPPGSTIQVVGIKSNKSNLNHFSSNCSNIFLLLESIESQIFESTKTNLNQFQLDSTPRWKDVFNVSDYILHLAMTLLELSTKKPYNKYRVTKTIFFQKKCLYLLQF